MTMDNGLYLPGLARDEKVVEAYKNDPLVTRKVSARLGMELIEKGAWILKHANELDIPLLLMQGTEDKLVNPQGSEEFNAKAPKQWITYKEWKGFFHELHNEPEKMDVLNFELDWIKKQLSHWVRQGSPTGEPFFLTLTDYNQKAKIDFASIFEWNQKSLFED
jgi:alpha-beta hydrolase superfamily lysophospholipase